MRVQFAAESAFEPPERQVEIIVNDPTGQSGKTPKGLPIGVGGAEHFHGDELEVSAEEANGLLHARCAELIGKGTVKIRVLDPRGAPQPHSVGIRFGGKHVPAGEKVKVPLSMARDMVRNRTGVWPHGREQ